MAAGSGGEVVFAARDDSPERCCAPCTAPQAAKVGTRAVPFRAARSLNDWGNSQPLPLRSGQCLGWAWRGESSESLGTEVNPAAGLGLGGQALCKTLKLAVKPVSRLPEILSHKTALNLSVPVPTHTQM